MADGTVRVERAGGIVRCTLDRPPLNLFEPGLIAALRDTFTTLARDDAVRAVSLPEKKAESSRQIRTTTNEIHSFAVIDYLSLSVRNARTSAASTFFSMKAWPMPRTNMNVSVPRFTFLS